jgi:carboxymethylenebutenolidase
VLVPDIYKGKIGVDQEEAHHLMSNLDFPAAVEEIITAAAHLKKEGSPNVGIVGFCMGGALTLGALAKSVDLKCGAPFYGVNFGLFDPEDLKNKPVQVKEGVGALFFSRCL